MSGSTDAAARAAEEAVTFFRSPVGAEIFHHISFSFV